MTTHDAQMERYTEPWVDLTAIAAVRDNEHEITSLLNQLKCAEAELTASERTYEALRHSLARTT
jgi:hypothetical protein